MRANRKSKIANPKSQIPMLSPSLVVPAFASWAFLVGASVGSFLNVCIYRLPRNESVVFPASHCPWCNTRLRLTDLVPLVSQLVLRSRCRYCGQWFSWRYFGVELLTGLCFAGLAWRYGFTWQLLPYAVLTAALLAAVFTDLDCWLIPDELTLVAALAGVGYDLALLVRHQTQMLRVPVPWPGHEFQAAVPQSVAGMLFAGGVVLLVGWIGTRLFRKESMGGGDVKLAAAVGAHLGLTAHLLSFFLVAVTAGSAVGIILLIARRKHGKDYLPFGPMLAGGALAVLFFGQWLTPALVRIYDPSVLWWLLAGHS